MLLPHSLSTIIIIQMFLGKKFAQPKIKAKEPLEQVIKDINLKNLVMRMSKMGLEDEIRKAAAAGK